MATDAPVKERGGATAGGSLNLRQIAFEQEKEAIAPGHKLCPGCGITVIMRQLFAAVDYPILVANATGCLEVCSGNLPYTSWRVPWIHNAFENTAATASGMEAMIKALRKKGKLPEDKPFKVLAIGGDGQPATNSDQLHGGGVDVPVVGAGHDDVVGIMGDRRCQSAELQPEASHKPNADTAAAGVALDQGDLQ